jgi:hypothetical protein
MNEQTPLTPEKVQQISAALSRFREIGSLIVIDPRSEAELTGLKNFFANVLLEHGSEFVGSWIAAKYEYEPLLTAVSHVAGRVSAAIASRKNPVTQTNE